MKSVLTFNVEKTLQNNGTADIYNFKIINGFEEYTVTWTNKPSSNGSYLVSFEADDLSDYYGENAPNVTENNNSKFKYGFEGAEWQLFMSWDWDWPEIEAEIHLLCNNQIFLTIGPFTLDYEENYYMLLEMPYLQGSYNTGW